MDGASRFGHAPPVHGNAVPPFGHCGSDGGGGAWPAGVHLHDFGREIVELVQVVAAVGYGVAVEGGAGSDPAVKPGGGGFR